MAVSDTAVYLLDNASQIREIDPSTGSQRAIHPTGTATAPRYIGVEEDLLYLFQEPPGEIAIFDPKTNTVLQVVPQGGFPVGRDPYTDILWLADQFGSTVRPYNPQTKTYGQAIGLAGKPRGLAFGISSIWVAAQGFVIRIDREPWGTLLPSNGLATIPMPDGATAVSIAVDEQTDKIWVSTCQGCGI